MRINVKTAIIDLIVLLPITTLFQGMIPIINKVVFFAIILLLLYLVVKNKYTRAEILAMVGFSIVYVAAFLFTKGAPDNANEYYYLLFFIIYSIYVSKNFEDIKKYCEIKSRYIKGIALIWNAAVFVSLFLPSSYQKGYFFSFTGSVFRSATSATFVLALVLVIAVENRKNAILALLPIYCLFAGGSRTYLAIGLVLAVLLFYMVAPSKKIFWISLIPIISLAVVFLLNSNIINKINESMTVHSTDYYQDPLIKFTSGRSLFWEADMKAFFNGSKLNQIVGFGYNFVYDVNMTSIRNRIWAHNDFINILLCYGYIGLGCYIYFFLKMFQTCTSNLKLSNIFKFMVFFVWAFNAFFNMFYTYVCACASYPFVLIAIAIFCNVREKKEQKGWGKK